MHVFTVKLSDIIQQYCPEKDSLSHTVSAGNNVWLELELAGCRGGRLQDGTYCDNDNWPAGNVADRVKLLLEPILYFDRWHLLRGILFFLFF